MTQDPNLATLELVVQALGSVADELVLVGGCAVGLLLTDPAPPPVRQTIDVDLLTEVAPTANYYEFCERLRAKGFREQPNATVICRWAKGPLLVDVMPVDGNVLGFTNAWYAEAARTASVHVLPSGKEIRVVSPPVFLATKLEAFRSRGNGDYLHHDIEDIVTVVDGRASIANEVAVSSQSVREFLTDEFEALLGDESFVERVHWHIGSDSHEARVTLVLQRLRRIAGI